MHRSQSASSWLCVLSIPGSWRTETPLCLAGALVCEILTGLGCDSGEHLEEDGALVTITDDDHILTFKLAI